MNAEEYKYLEDTLAGRRGRDKAIEEKMTAKPEGKISRAAIERQRVVYLPKLKIWVWFEQKKRL